MATREAIAKMRGKVNEDTAWSSMRRHSTLKASIPAVARTSNCKRFASSILARYT